MLCNYLICIIFYKVTDIALAKLAALSGARLPRGVTIVSCAGASTKALRHARFIARGGPKNKLQSQACDFRQDLLKICSEVATLTEEYCLLLAVQPPGSDQAR